MPAPGNGNGKNPGNINPEKPDESYKIVNRKDACKDLNGEQQDCYIKELKRGPLHGERLKPFYFTFCHEGLCLAGIDLVIQLFQPSMIVQNQSESEY